MLSFRKLDVYQRAIEFLTGEADAARAYAIARGTAMECAAVLDALLVLKVVEPETHRRGLEILARIVAMLTKLCR